MDAVHQSDEPIDIGVCHQHNRVFECYCTKCYCMICPSCLMFDSHKNHQVCRIQEGAKDLRSKINGAAREGLLKFQKTENVLLDIRHSKLSIEQNLQKILKSSQQYFDAIIKAVKTRKTIFMQQVKQFFTLQIQSIDNIQNSWLQKQEICQKVLKLQSSTDDLKIMQQAKYIVEGLQKLGEQMKYQQIKLIQNIQNSININKHRYQFNELKDSFKEFIKKGPVITNQLKC